MPTYSERLRDPRWQKKRLEIMQRDGFACTLCQDERATLNVHHCYYEQDRDPWDYPDTSLLTLCQPCHEKETHFLKVMKRGLAIELGKLGARSVHYYELAMAFARLDPKRLDQAVWFVGFFLTDTDFQGKFFRELDLARPADAQEVPPCPPTA
jgi:hypothetical protein